MLNSKTDSPQGLLKALARSAHQQADMDEIETSQVQASILANFP
jgi:hypothetical protein